MRGYTHAIIGAAAAAWLHTQIAYLPTVPPWVLLAATAGAVGGLLPDADSGESIVRRATHTNRRAGCLGWLASKIIGPHRGMLHTIWIALPLAAVAWWFPLPAARPYMIALAVGYASHLAADVIWGMRFIAQVRIGKLRLDDVLDWAVVLSAACVLASSLMKIGNVVAGR